MLGQCRLSRFGSFSPKVFNRLSCANCYNLLVYVSPDTKLHFNVSYGGYLVSDDLGFDPTDPNDILGIKSSMQLSEFDRWRACCVSAERCCSKVMVKSPTNSSGHCTSIWDGWSCHKDTLAGQISKVKCPYYVLGDTCNTVFESAYFKCESNGSWFENSYGKWANYTGCVQSFLDLKERLINVNIICQTISLIFLLIGLCIFLSYKQLKVNRILLHKNFFVSLIFHSITQILWESIVMKQNLHNVEKFIETNHSGCIFFNLLLQYTRSTNYFWMFSESLYLFKLLISVFKEESTIYTYYFIGWGIPLILCSIYAFLTFMLNNNSCWTKNTALTYVINIPNVLTILLNFIFLIRIIRELYKKLTASNTNEPHQYKKAVRATLILVPLFGLHLILSPFVMCESAPGSQVHNFINRLVESLQGFVVSVIYCFLNAEVGTLLKSSFFQLKFVKKLQKKRQKFQDSSEVFECKYISMNKNKNSNQLMII